MVNKLYNMYFVYAYIFFNYLIPTHSTVINTLNNLFDAQNIRTRLNQTKFRAITSGITYFCF